jgi:TolA-binding protein
MSLISQTTAAEKKATEATEKADAAACEAARAMEQILEMRLEINKANERAEQEVTVARREAKDALERANKAESQLKQFASKAEEAEKQLSVLAERAQVAESSVDILRRQLDAKEMLVDAMIEDQQGSRQSSIEIFNIDSDAPMKDGSATGDEEFSGWSGGEAAKKPSTSYRETPSEPESVRVLIDVIYSPLTCCRIM